MMGFNSSIAPIDPSVIFASYPGIQLDPSDLTKMWSDSGKTTAANADGHLVRIMTDKGPAIYDFDSTTDALRPTLRTDGTHYWIESNLKVLRHASANPTASQTQFTRILAFERISVLSNCFHEFSHNCSIMQYSGGTLSFYSNSGIRRTTTMISAPKIEEGLPILLTQVFDGSLPATHADRNKIYVNGALFSPEGTVGTINSSTASTAGVFIGSNSTATTNAANMKWWQYLSFGGIALDDATRRGVEQFCRNKMGV